jgi:hypothetical protein
MTTGSLPATAPPPAPSAAASAATETVRRPEPGLARGVWEAPRWAFFAAMGAVLVFAIVYALVRSGAFRRPRARGGPV